MNQPLISIIITTKNEEKNIKSCIESIIFQTYRNKEIIVIDNNSTDKTKDIAKKYTSYVYNKGPERSSQRNYGAKKAKGEFLLFLDADMILTKSVLSECVSLMNDLVGGVFIPEESIGDSFWAKAKKLERSFYIGQPDIEAARFYKRSVFFEMKGFDQLLTGPEDWDLSKRVQEKYILVNAKEYILHNEGNLSLLETIEKKYYYAKHMRKYMVKNYRSSISKLDTNPFSRFLLFFSAPQRLFKDPVLGIGMIFMKVCEYSAGAVGYYFNRVE